MTEYACGKQRVIAILFPSDGSAAVMGENTRRQNRLCPRYDMKSGEGYFHCEECLQENHAEINAINKAEGKAKGATMIILGHDYACDACKERMEEAGIESVIVAGKIYGFNVLRKQL